MSTDVTTRRTSWVDTPPRSPFLRNLSATLLTKMPWLDGIAGPLQKWINKAYGEPGQPQYKVKDMLNGVWLGHTLHPVMVTVPIGAWTATSVMDTAWLFTQDESMAKGADVTLWIGMVGAVGSAATGATNWTDTYGSERRAGMFHALLNSGVTVLNLASGILRFTGQRRTAIALTTVAYAATAVSAYIGGELSYSAGVGVNHVAWEGGPDEFVPVLDEQELQEGRLTRVIVDGVPAVLIKDNKNIYAIAATCSHAGGPLNEGTYKDGVVYCPWHKSGFNMCDGSVANSPAVYSQPTFAVRIRNGKVELRRLEHA